jgi:hypothetical protein
VTAIATKSLPPVTRYCSRRMQMLQTLHALTSILPLHLSLAERAWHTDTQRPGPNQARRKQGARNHLL